MIELLFDAQRRAPSAFKNHFIRYQKLEELLLLPQLTVLEGRIEQTESLKKNEKAFFKLISAEVAKVDR